MLGVVEAQAVHAGRAGVAMTDDATHDDACRCQGCCAARFKTIDPARVGRAPELPADSSWLRGVPAREVES
jgi:hypothetical protein